MKCPICHGKGRVQDHKYNEEHDIEYLVYCEKKCEYCNGTGEVNEPLQTNEEWLRTCSTEELAEWIVHIADQCTISHECNLCESWCDEKKVMEWLKEKHDG